MAVSLQPPYPHSPPFPGTEGIMYLYKCTLHLYINCSLYSVTFFNFGFFTHQDVNTASIYTLIFWVNNIKKHTILYTILYISMGNDSYFDLNKTSAQSISRSIVLLQKHKHSNLLLCRRWTWSSQEKLPAQADSMNVAGIGLCIYPAWENESGIQQNVHKSKAVTVTISYNKCFQQMRLVLYLYFIYILSPYVFRAFLGPSSGVSQAVVMLPFGSYVK
jgi:hypothetical protein